MCYKKQRLLYNADKLGQLTRHHRKPRSQGGGHEGENISHVPEKLHQAYHLLFANLTAKRIADILNEHFIDPEYQMVAIPKEALDAVRKALLENRY